jgi:hypothetical protein
MSKPLYAFCGLLQRAFCCCCQSSKADKKTDAIVENGEFNKAMDQDSTEAISTQNIKYVPDQNLYPSRFQRAIALQNINERQNYFIEGMKSTKINPTDVGPIENEMATPKCNFCNRCKSCQADFDKDKAKDKNKKDIEAKCNTLNYLVLLCVSLFMFVSNLTVWLLMSR